jgi:hypothetical protein
LPDASTSTLPSDVEATCKPLVAPDGELGVVPPDGGEAVVELLLPQALTRKSGAAAMAIRTGVFMVLLLVSVKEKYGARAARRSGSRL